MQDIPAIAEAAHASGALVLMDNTWATPLYFRAARQGRRSRRSRPAPNISAAIPTCMLGMRLGQRSDAGRSSSDDCRRASASASVRTTCISALRGLRTMAVRLAASSESGARRSRAGSRRGRRSRACCIRRSRAIPATRSGSATSPARRGLFSIVLKPVPRAGRRTPSSMRSTLFGIGLPGAASRAS